MKIHLKLTFLAILLSQLVSAQYLHQQGRYIVDGQGNEFIIRSMGLGGWMLQEGYMMESADFANTQHQLKVKIEQLVGKEGMEAFYDAWLTNYCQKEDIDSMAAWGFNAIRLPMHYNLFTLPIEQELVPGQDTWHTRGFEMVDQLLDWCEANQMYLILDLHAAPGGQGKDAAISDYDSSKPSLWESAENQRKTVALWKKLAERYANEPWIGGYDLLNETNWDMPGNTLLKTLYNQIITEVRKVDKNHLIFIEGNWFANDFTGLTPALDTNMAYSFHKYWSYNDQGSIQGYIDMRNKYNVPLWMGEAGENSNPWFTSAISLFEKNKIGWAWWPYKKIASVTGTVTIPKTAGYQALLNYWKGTGAKPSVETAQTYLMEQAEMLKLSNCVIHRDVLDAMFRQAQGDKSPKPFKRHTAPGTIYAVDYDLGGNNRAYFDTDTANYNVSTQVYTAWNSGYAYRNDAVDIEVCRDAAGTNGYSVGWVNDNEWMIYTVDIDSSAIYQFDLRYAASGSTGSFHLQLDGVDITPIISLSSSGSWSTWKTHTLNNVILSKGTHQIKLYVDKAGFNINYLKFSNPRELATVTPEILNSKTDNEGKSIYLTSNVSFDATSSPLSSEFSVTVNGNPVATQTVAFDPQSSYGLVVKIGQQLKSTDVILLSYRGQTLKTSSGYVFATFENMRVLNYSPTYATLPGTIQAENFNVNVGLSLENSTDTGGGQNIAYTNNGDYLDYQVFISSRGTYSMEYRVASPNGGILELQLADNPSAPVLIHSVTVPITGGWQTWRTVTLAGKLPEGFHTLRVYIRQMEFNLNWFRVSLVTSSPSIEQTMKVEVYPNPVSDRLYIESSNTTGDTEVSIIDLSGRVLSSKTFKAATSKMEIDFSGFKSGSYIVRTKNSGRISNHLIVK